MQDPWDLFRYPDVTTNALGSLTWPEGTEGARSNRQIVSSGDATLDGRVYLPAAAGCPGLAVDWTGPHSCPFAHRSHRRWSPLASFGIGSGGLFRWRWNDRDFNLATPVDLMPRLGMLAASTGLMSPPPPAADKFLASSPPYHGFPHTCVLLTPFHHLFGLNRI